MQRKGERKSSPFPLQTYLYQTALCAQNHKAQENR
jgi:hypothetical protein